MKENSGSEGRLGTVGSSVHGTALACTSDHLLPTQVLLQTGDPGTGGWPAARLQVWQELQWLEGGRGWRESELTVWAGPRT